LNYHLDTSFLVDWQREDPAVENLVTGILDGEHTISITGIVFTEFMAARLITPRKRLVAGIVLRLAEWLPVSLETSRTASRWLAPMSRDQRRAFFADALIAAASHERGATLLTGDTTAARIFPVATQLYR
jgi:predicted nucleic acid-binding protein